MPKLRTSPEWHNEARRLREQGLEPTEIARILERSSTMVRWVLNENGERAKTLDRARRSRGCVNPRAEAARPARAPSGIRVDTMALARLFAAGEIDRSELSRRLRGEELSA